ncbi:MAG: ABC-type uncharacterized transport system involved in gliding motility auxiliary subunit, partial [Myxococcota bacterium]
TSQSVSRSKGNVTRGKKLGAALNAVIGIAAGLTLMVAANWFAYGTYQRYDLTENEVNSLSQTSIDAVQTMEGLEIRLYQSARMPRALEGPRPILIENTPRLLQQLTDKLDEYKRASNGNAQIMVIQEELESVSSALSLTALKVPSDRSDDVDPDALNKSYYLAMSLHYRTVEEVLPVVWNPATFEYDLTKALLRLKSKQAASAVMRDLLDTGLELNEAVDECVKTIEKYNQDADKDPEEDLEGGLLEQVKTQQGDRSKQIAEYLANMDQIDGACGKVTSLLEKQRAELKTRGANEGELSVEHFEALLNKIGWFDGIYGAWVASLIDGNREPAQLERLLRLLDHPEIPARTSALRVLAGWLTGTPEKPGLQGPAAEQGIRAIAKAQKDAEPIVRAVALQVACSGGGERAAVEIGKALGDPDATVREVALDLAMKLRVTVEAGKVRPFLKDTSWSVRRLSVAYLVNTRQATVQDLRPMLKDTNKEVKFVAAYGLTQLKDLQSETELKLILDQLAPGQERMALKAALEKMAGESAVNKPEGAAPPTPAPPALAPAPEGAAPTPTPAPGPAGTRTPHRPGAQGNPPPPQGGGVRSALGRAGTDRLGDMQLPDPITGIETLSQLKGEISTAYTTLKDSPGRRTIGFLCGHQEFCPFEETESKIPDELVAAFEQQPFIKKAVDDIKNLEANLNGTNESIRRYFMQYGYRVIKVDAGKPVPSEVDALFIYGPRKPFSDRDLYDVDQFMLTGRPVVMFTNSYTVAVNQWDDKPPYDLTSTIKSVDTNLNPFLSHYGVKANNDLVMETAKSAYEKITTVAMTPSNIGPLPMSARYSYPMFPVFEIFSETDPLVAGLRRVTLPYASSFSHVEGAQPGVSFDAIIKSSETSVAKTANFVLDPKALRDSVMAEQTSGSLAVAVHLTGEASSYFAGKARPAGAVAEGETAPKSDEKPQTDTGNINLVIIGSNLGWEDYSPSRILHDFNLGAVAQEKVTGLSAAIPYYIRFVNMRGRILWPQNPIHLGQRGQMQQIGGQQAEFWQKNLEFLFGVFDWATGEEGMAAIRAKADTDRPLKINNEDTVRAVSWGLVAGLPLAFMLVAIFRFWLRRLGRRRLGAA